MIDSIFSKLTKVYQFGFILLICVTLGTVFYFWKMGFIDGSKIQNLHKASFVIETYSKKNSLKDIQDFAKNETPKKSIDRMSKILKEFKTVDATLSIEEFDDVKENIKELTGEANKLIKFTNSGKVILVFRDKLNKFHRFVKGNNWRTLTRMSERIHMNVSGHVNKDALGKLSFKVLRDFDSMIKITENSVLSRADKSQVVSRINNLKTEMQMLERYAQARASFNKRFNRLESAVELWVNKVSPEVTMGKLENQELGKFYIFAMLGIVALISVLFFISFGFNSWYLKRAKRQLEQKIENYLSDGIIGCDPSLYEEGSIEFREFSQNMSSYIAKRMSFGSMFQESLPFASILLDQNLKVVWANTQFCSDWEISSDEIKKEYMSWDYLNKLTNIGTDDPVMEALKNNIAGIYQIQMKSNENADARPYEMFVAPINDNGETRIMLYFYDLTNLQETIKDQSKSILNPVKKSVDHIIAGDFVASEQMEYEFKIAGIEDVYEKFISLNENIYYTENELLAKLRSSEFDFNKVSDVLENVYDLNGTNNEELQNIKNALKSFRDNVIELSEMSKTLCSSLDRSRELVCTNIAALKASSSKVNNMRNMTQEVTESLPNFDEVKTQMKTVKKDFSDNKVKLASEITQLKKLIDQKNDARLNANSDKVISAFETLINSGEELDKKVSSLEIGISKAQMIINSSKDKIFQINDEYEVSQIQYSQGEVNRLSKLKALPTIEQLEQNIVAGLSDLYDAQKSVQKTVRDISETNVTMVTPEEHFSKSDSISIN